MGLLEDGAVIRETYEVERFLGEGVFGEVYRVKHTFFGRQAMKVFKTTGMTLDETRETLVEAIMLSRLGHPNIIRVFEANTTTIAGRMCGFYTMEYVAGGSLDQFWRSHGTRLVSVETVVDIIGQASRGLAVAHGEDPPIIHRDIKPQNILVGYDMGGLRVLVSDFGLAKRANPLTLRATSAGTPAFKAPEAFREAAGDSCAGDVWGLGCVLYLLLTDRLPYSAPGGVGGRDTESFAQPMVPASLLNIHVDAALDQIVDRALALAPQDRYQSAGELVADLEQWKPPSATIGAGRKRESAFEISKEALGRHATMDEPAARQAVEDAFALASQAARLSEAADLLEEALNRWPDLRDEYAYRLQLWRRGIVN